MSNSVSYNEKDFRPASFRGLAFVAQVVEHGGGRITVDHQIVDGAGWVEDTGRQLRTFSVQAVVTGENYLKDSKALDKALDAPDAGTFVHPWLGSLSVSITSWKARVGGKLGAVEYSIECKESGKPADTSPVSVPDNKSWADKFRDAVASKFTGDWGAVGNALDTAAQAVQQVNEAASAVTDAVRAYADPSKVGAVLQQVENLTAQAEGLVRMPGNLAASWMGMVDPLVRAGTLASLRSALAIPMPSSSEAPSPSERTQQALAGLVRAVTASAGCQALVGAVAAGDVQTYDDAVSLLALATSTIETVGQEANDPVVYRAALDLRDATDKAVTDLALSLPRVRTWTPPRTMSVLEVCQRVYGSGANAEDVIARNGLVSPGWVTAPLRLLNQEAA